MLKIFGKNNNQLFRNSSKTTYSMPQPLQFQDSILTCACGYDFVAIITNHYRLYILFQTKFYLIQNVPLIADLATAENTLTMITTDNQVLVWDFDQDKVIKRNINYTRLKIGLEMDDKIKHTRMGGNDIFLVAQSGKIYHFKRNNWYETKSYSNIESLQLTHKIIDVSAGPKNNLFLSYQGFIFMSSKEDPLVLSIVKTANTFIKVATDYYCAGITKKGTIMIWGNSIHGNFNEPVEFTKLAKKFIDVKLDKQNGYALADDGEVWVWGTNANGQLGLSDYETRIKPFPLVTLQKSHVIQIFCGYSYACCLCLPNQKLNHNSVKVLNNKVSQFQIQRLQQREFGKNIKQLTDIRSNIKQNKSPFNKISQYKQQNEINQKYCNSNKNIQSNKVWTISDQQNVYSNQNNVSNISLQVQVLELREENRRLKQRVSEQSDVINDITEKIRLLQQAIDEYQKSLTSRDHILQDYQSKEQQYICHIGQLQKTIDEIVKQRQKNNEILVVYQDLKTNLEKQRQYYSSKMNQYEKKLFCQQQKYKEEIEKLQPKTDLLNKQNYLPQWQSQSPIIKKVDDSPHFRIQKQERKANNQSMESVIDQIEANKSLITKSANKLIAMLDISQ